MKLQYINDHISIKEFEPIEIPTFTVLTGMNGSGKTHFLQAIKAGNIEIENISKSEVVYYNYNEFTVLTEDARESLYNHNRLNNWEFNKRNLLDEINQFKTSIYLKFIEGKLSIDRIICTLIFQPNFDPDSFPNQEDYETFEKAKNDGKLTSDGFQYEYKFSNFFNNFLIHCFHSPEINLNELDKDELKEKFDKILKEIELTLKNKNEELYNFLTKNSTGKSIFSITEADFESPNLFLEEIENAEKDYEFLKKENSINKVEYDDWGDSIEYLEKDAFIARYGRSPIEQINKVLSEYDCNGYYFSNNSFRPKLGINKDQQEIKISLEHKDANYKTDFDQLSSGEKTLIALSLLIYKSRTKRIIPRVLLLDEIDSSLHPSMIKRLLDVIQELFVKQQGFIIILATHSPTTIALSPEESIFQLLKKGNQKILKQNKADAISLLSEGFVTLNNEDTNLSIEYNINKTDLPILFTEGITDKIIIETAWRKINGNGTMPFFVQDCFDAGFLSNLFKRGYDNQTGILITHPERKLMALFDFDGEGYNSWNSLSKFSEIIEKDPTKSLTRSNPEMNGFALLLPVPEIEDIKNQVIKDGSETFKDKSSLTIELLFYSVAELSDFFSVESTAGGGKLISFKGKKRDFANRINDLSSEHFSNFIPLFNKIEEIIAL